MLFRERKRKKEGNGKTYPFNYGQSTCILPLLNTFAVNILHSVTLKMTKLFLIRQLHHPPSVIQLMVENEIQMSRADMAGQPIKLIASLKSSSTCTLPCYPN